MAKANKKIPQALFIDIGGVLLNNGWDRKKRADTFKKFALDQIETEERHHLTFDTYEEGKISLDTYLDRVVFYTKRPFTRTQFKKHLFSLSAPYPEMIDLIKAIKMKYQIPIVVVSNEGRELNDHRINRFGLHEFIDFFVSSSFVHIRKPDADIFKLAIDLAQVDAKRVLYIDDRELFVQVAQKLGLIGIVHETAEKTACDLQKYGLIL